MPSTRARIFAELIRPEPPATPRVLLRRAVVLGASIAGLMAARVLSDHATEVVVLDRDGTPPSDTARRGVPHGGQLHGLLQAGQAQVERWFPGILADAVAAGAVVPPLDSVEYWQDGVRSTYPPVYAGQEGFVCTRPLLEHLLRRRVDARPNVRFLHGRADGLAFDGNRVAGVRYGLGNVTTVQDADLVVDATGRSSRIGDWLCEAGYHRPELTRMTIQLNYATALFRRDPRDTSIVVATTSPGADRVARIGGISPVEGDRWMMLVAGYADDRPDTDLADFRRRCAGDFPEPFGRIAGTCEPVSAVTTYHQSDSRRRRFEPDHLPAGLVVAGDAFASFNPIYGQGMTSAMLHATCLSAWLREEPRLDQPARGYFDRAAVVVDAAWQVSTFADFALPHVRGPYPPGYRGIRWFNERLLRASMTDRTLSERVGRVTTMLAHPDSLARPSTLVRTARLTAFR